MSGRKRFAQEQIDRAAESDIGYFLSTQGYTLKRTGQQYTWERPGGSPVSINGNKWYSHYEKVGGDAISFLQKYFGYGFREAVSALTGDEPMRTENRPPPEKKEGKPKILELPPKAEDNLRVFAYLTKQRLIAPEIVNLFIGQGLLYESREPFKDKFIHNLVIVGKDKDGVPRQGHIKGLTTGKKFRHNAPGTDDRFGFAHIGTSNRIFAFEAAIDMMSYLTLFPNQWQVDSYVALDGTSEHALMTVLDDHPNINRVVLALDNDPGGLHGAIRLAGLLLDRGVQVELRPPPMAKDWNELLKCKARLDYEPNQPDPILHRVANQADHLYSLLAIRRDETETAEKLGWYLEKWNGEDDLEMQREQLQNIALYAALRANVLLRPCNREVEKTRFLTRLCAQCGWIDKDRSIESFMEDLKNSADSLRKREQEHYATTEQQRLKLAEEYLALAGKALTVEAICQTMEQEVVPCRMAMC